MNTPNDSTAERTHGSLHPAGSASDYNPAQCLRAEVERFKATNRFTPMDVTGFYIQAAVVLDEHRRMVEALRQLSECNLTDDNCAGLDVANRRIRNIARRAIPMSETPRTPNVLGGLVATKKDTNALDKTT
jgi:ribosomal protein S7